LKRHENGGFEKGVVIYVKITGRGSSYSWRKKVNREAGGPSFVKKIARLRREIRFSASWKALELYGE